MQAAIATELRQFDSQNRLREASSLVRDYRGHYEFVAERYLDNSYDKPVVNPTVVDAFRNELDESGLLGFSTGERPGAAMLAVLLFGERYLEQAVALLPEFKAVPPSHHYSRRDYAYPIDLTCDLTKIPDQYRGELDSLHVKLFCPEGWGQERGPWASTEGSAFYFDLISDPDFRWYGVTGYFNSLVAGLETGIYSQDHLELIPELDKILDSLGLTLTVEQRLMAAQRFCVDGSNLELAGSDPYGLNNLADWRQRLGQFQAIAERTVGADAKVLDVTSLMYTVNPEHYLAHMEWLAEAALEKPNRVAPHKRFLFEQAQQNWSSLSYHLFKPFMRALAQPNFWRTYVGHPNKSGLVSRFRDMTRNWSSYSRTIPVSVARYDASDRMVDHFLNPGASGTVRFAFGLPFLRQIDRTPKRSFQLARQLFVYPGMEPILAASVPDREDSVAAALQHNSRVRGWQSQKEQFENKGVQGQRRARRQQKLDTIESTMRVERLQECLSGIFPRAAEEMLGSPIAADKMDAEIENAVGIWFEMQGSAGLQDREGRIPYLRLMDVLKGMLVERLNGDDISVYETPENQAFLERLREADIDPEPWLSGHSDVFEVGELEPHAVQAQRDYFLDNIQIVVEQYGLSVDDVVADFDAVADQITNANHVRDIRIQLSGLQQWGPEKLTALDGALKVRIHIERDPFRKLMLGSLVDHSCYRPGGGNAWNAVAIAMNVNLGVAWGEPIGGQGVIGRKILGINNDFRIQHYRTHYRGRFNLEAPFETYTSRLANKMRTGLANKGTVSAPASGMWDDDGGSVPFLTGL